MPTDQHDQDLPGASEKCATVTDGGIEENFFLPAADNEDGWYRVAFKDSSGDQLGEKITGVLITTPKFNFDDFLADQLGNGPTVTPYTRAVAGVSADSQSSGSVTNQYFIELSVQYPLLRKGNPADAPVWVWLTPRISTLPSSTGIPLNSLGSVSSPVTGAGSSKSLLDVTQGFEALGGLEFRLTRPSATRIVPGPSPQTKASLSLIIGAGIITPISPFTAPQLVKLTPDLKTFYKIPTCVTGTPPTGQAVGTCPDNNTEIPVTDVALVPQGRDRFFRQGYAGFRIKTHFMSDSGENEIGYPGTFDVTWGFDEAVTGGHIRGGVIRVEAFYPFPFKVTKHALYVFGTLIMKPAINHIPPPNPPLVLVPSDSTVTVASPGVFVQPVRREDRDYYRLGIGFDLVALVSAVKGK